MKLNCTESSLREISTLLIQIEDEREQMLTQLEESFVRPMERFRKNDIGTAKEEKKKFDKQTSKYCASLERYLGAKAKSLGDDKLLEEVSPTHSHTCPLNRHVHIT